jgi:hypothetical protein
MLTTHFPVSSTIDPATTDAKDSRLEIRLLSACLSLAETIDFDKTHGKLFLRYDAGMTDSDIVMRQVLFLYCERYQEVSQLDYSWISVVSLF